MIWWQVGGIFLFLIGVWVFGHLWFSLVETLLSKIRKWFSKNDTPPVWYFLDEEKEGQDETDKQ